MTDTKAETPSMVERLRSGHCAENTGCGTMTQCVCATSDDAAEYIESLERDLAAARAIGEKAIDFATDKIMAMSDEQIFALTRLEGHDPADIASLGKQAAKLALLTAELEREKERTTTAERDAAQLQEENRLLHKACDDLEETAEERNQELAQLQAELAEKERLVAFWQKSSEEWKASRERHRERADELQSKLNKLRAPAIAAATEGKA